MLRRFIYLDTSALSQYVTALEGGLVTESTTRSLRSGAGKGGVDAKLVQASGERAREDEESQTFSDTDEARFERLLRAAAAEPETLAWVEVLNPDTDFDKIGIGAMVSWECDLYVPEVVQTMAKSGEALGAIEMMQRVLPAARQLGLDTEDLPDDEEMGAVAGFVSGLNADLLVVGEDDGTNWRIAGHLNENFLHGDIEERARIVGKVSKTLLPGHWKPYLTFPGMKLLSRAERRTMERQAPDSRQEGEYLSGPALVLDLLAIYR